MKLSEFVNKELGRYDALREVVSDPSYNRTAQRADDKLEILLAALDDMGLQVIEGDEQSKPAPSPPEVTLGKAEEAWPYLVARLRGFVASVPTVTKLGQELVADFEALGIAIQGERAGLRDRVRNGQERLDEIASARYGWPPGEGHGYSPSQLAKDVAALRTHCEALLIENRSLKEETKGVREARFSALLVKCSALGLVPGETWKRRCSLEIFRIHSITRDDLAGALVTMEGEQGTWSINGFLDDWQRYIS